MYWELEVDLAPETEEIWSLFCYDRGAEGAEQIAESPGHLAMRYFFPAEPSGAAQDWLRVFSTAHPGLIPPLRLSLNSRAVENWQDAWREHFAATPVGRRLLICPPWDLPAPGKTPEGRVSLIIDPGQGFGTGRHPSTALALELIEAQLESVPPPDALLDVGTGSGILSIAARLLGVARVWGLDIEGPALAEVRRNFHLNGLAPAPVLVRGRPDCLTGGFPLVLANLTTPILADLAGALAHLTSPGGCLVLSGILQSEHPRIEAIYGEREWSMLASAQREGWWACRLLRNP
ncbi:MAG: 50S ribosomal protein L11 methyltransferase [SAR324 cluster bacterium]|nr:50S ribosomal protein L11 methyltransferase [SAR324 cluster bacterium]